MAREVVASGAVTTSGNSGALIVGADGNRYTDISLFASITTVTGTSPTMDLTIEWSSDGSNWFSVDGTAQSFAQVTSTTKNVCKSFNAMSDMYRIVWTLGGTAPSFTFAVDEVAFRQ